MARTITSIPVETADGASCPGLTCMEWSDAGELTDGDCRLIQQRLVRADPHAQAIIEILSVDERCPSIS